MILASSRSFIRRLFVIILMILGIFLAGFSWFALSIFEKSFVPELHKKAELMATRISDDVTQALGYGIALDQLAGMEPYLTEFVEENIDIGHILLRQDQTILYQAKTQQTFQDPDEVLALSGAGYEGVKIEVYLSDTFLKDKFQSVALDQLTALFIAILIAFEVLCYIVYGRIFNPLHVIEQVFLKAKSGVFTHTVHSRASAEMQRIETRINHFLFQLSEKRRDVLDNAQDLKSAQMIDQVRQNLETRIEALKAKVQTAEPYGFQDLPTKTVRNVRFPLFLFMFGEELSRPFLPLLAQSYALPTFLEGQPQLGAGIPIALFMGMIVLISLISGPWLEKWGARRLFMAGCLPAFLGYVGVFFAENYQIFLLARSLSALGYGLVFVAAQSYFAQAAGASDRASNMALFVGAILVAGITGPAIGGIMAFKIGYGETFLLSAALVLLSLLFVFQAMENPTPVQDQRTPAPLQTENGFKHLMQHLPFVSVSVLCAVPAKIMLSGVLFLLTPLYLIELNMSEATIGRVLILYGIVIILAIQFISKGADLRQNHNQMVILGGWIAALGALLFFIQGGLWMMCLCVALIGLGQAFSMATQLAQVQKILHASEINVSMDTGLGLFRAIERSGSVIGPLLAGGLVLAYDIETAFILIGAYAAISVTLYGLISLWLRKNGGDHASS